MNELLCYDRYKEQKSQMKVPRSFLGCKILAKCISRHVEWNARQRISGPPG
jgi:hypothetical protein